MAFMTLSQMAIYFNGIGSLEGPRSAAGKKRKGADNYHPTSNNNSKNYRQRKNQGRHRGNRNDNNH